MVIDNAPIGNTCPMIDNVIRSASYIKTTENEDDVNNILSVMEDIRSANQTLREWGNEQYHLTSETESEKEVAECTVNELKNDITALNDDIESITTKKDEALITVEEQKVEIKLLNDFTKELTDEKDLALATINTQNDEIKSLNDKVNELQKQLDIVKRYY